MPYTDQEFGEEMDYLFHPRSIHCSAARPMTSSRRETARPARMNRER
jgi:hypothetical protein